jgi:uncharacterized protein YdeI (YjbR/CyaY-like superfamily)
VDPKVDAYIGRSTKWPGEMSELRTILLGCGLNESVKWGKPCYGHGDKNIAIMQEMNDFLSLMFFKGALIEDRAGLLRSQGPNSRSALRLEFTSVPQVQEQADIIGDYVVAAIAVEDAGLSVGPAPELELVDELTERLATDPDLAAAFEGLTPGRQREYNLHIADAKQAKTREARIDKYVPQILAGKGMRDR